MSEDIRQHIFLPLPLASLKAGFAAPGSKDEKLKEIISNIEKQQQQVRNNIIHAAKVRLEGLADVDDNGSTAMDLDTPSEGEINLRTDYKTATDLLIANLAAPYVEGSGDPCVKSRSGRPNPPPGIRQVSPPPQIKLAKQALDQIDLYEQHASKAREYYVRALERRKSSTGLNAYSPTMTAPTVASPIDFSRDPRRRAR